MGLLIPCLFAGSLAAGLYGAAALATDHPGTTTGQLFFDDQVQPLLTARCGECHNPKDLNSLEVAAFEGI